MVINVSGQSPTLKLEANAHPSLFRGTHISSRGHFPKLQNILGAKNPLLSGKSRTMIE